MKCKMSITLAIFVLFLAVEFAFSQGISIMGSMGYALGRGGNDFDYSASYNSDYEQTSLEDHYLSIGKGLKLDGSLQVDINKGFGLRIGGGYSKMMPTLEVEMDYHDQPKPDTDEYQASIINIHCLAILTHKTAGLNPYAGFGGGLFFVNMSLEEQSYWGETLYEEKIEYSLGTTFGLLGVLGVESSLSDNLAFFAELNLQQVAFTLNEWEITKAVADGEDVLDEVDVDGDKEGKQKVREFEKDSTIKETPPILQGSNVGIRLGLKIGL